MNNHTTPLPKQIAAPVDILVVDDERDIRRLFRAVLGQEYAILETQTGASAVLLLQQTRPKLVFLDIMLPGRMNGLQVLSAIREDPALHSTTVIMVSGRSQGEDFDNARRHGANGYLLKPFSPMVLKTWVSRVLLGGVSKFEMLA